MSLVTGILMLGMVLCSGGGGGQGVLQESCTTETIAVAKKILNSNLPQNST
jgi:hypothetical protein